MGFNSIAQVHRNICYTLVGLILDLLDQDEPGLEAVLIVIKVLRAHRKHHIDKVVHQN